MTEGLMSDMSIPFSQDEIVALRALAHKPERQWWRDYPFLVSVLAFILSLFTSVISAYVAHIRDVHQEQAQLAATVGTIQELNLRQVQVHEKYGDTPYESQASGLIDNEIDSALHTAAGLALQLGPKASTGDLTAVAEGLYGLGEYRLSYELLRTALAAAQSANEESAALTDLGFYEIHTAGSKEGVTKGENYYREALELDRKFDLSGQPALVAWLRSRAELNWAYAMAPIDCAVAQNHFREGIKLLLHAPATIEFAEAIAAAKQQWNSGIGGVRECLPASGTPTLP